VRELENTIARLVALSRGGEIGVDALGTDTGGELATAASDDQPLRERVGEFERRLIARALESCDGNQSAAARELGVSRVTLIDKMKRYGILPKK
jgi:two-component system response regulator AtoC